MSPPDPQRLPSSHLTLAVQLVGDAVAALEPSGALVHANPAWTALFGGPGEGRADDAWIQAVREEDRAAFRDAIARAAATRATVEQEPLRVMDPRGEERRIRFTLAEDAETGHICAVGRDITAEGARTRERMIEAALIEGPIIVWAVDRNGIFVLQTGGGLSALGLPQGAFVGLNLFEIHAGRESVIDGVRRTLAGERVQEGALTLGKYLVTFTAPMRDADGAIMGASGLTLDVSELKRAHDELAEQLALIKAQEATIQQLSTPIIEVWRGVVVLPLVGQVTGPRAEDMTHALLARIVEKRVRFAILDVTGVASVEASTADALLRIVRAVALLGAESLLVGLQPDVARTVVALDIPLDGVKTLRNLEEGLRYCMARTREREWQGQT